MERGWVEVDEELLFLEYYFAVNQRNIRTSLLFLTLICLFIRSYFVCVESGFYFCMIDKNFRTDKKSRISQNFFILCSSLSLFLRYFPCKNYFFPNPLASVNIKSRSRISIFRRIIEGSHVAGAFHSKGRRRGRPIVLPLDSQHRGSGTIETRTWKHYKYGVTPATSRRSLLGVTGPARRVGEHRREKEEKGRCSSAGPVSLPGRPGNSIAVHIYRYTCVCARPWTFLLTTNSCVTPGPLICD